MDYFKQFIKSLPYPLAPKEQEELLIKYYETKDGDIREKLLAHNLRLCLQCTMDFCKRYDMYKLQEDIFSVCYDQLSRSLDRFNPAEEITFAHFAMKSMKLALYRHMRNEDYHNSFIAGSVAQTDNNEDQEVELFYFLYDDSCVQDEVQFEILREDIIRFIDGLKGLDYKKEMLKMYLGLNYPRPYTKAEIAKHFNCSRETASTTVSKYLKLVQKYVSTKYASSFPDYAEKVKKTSPKFKDANERNQYILKSYYNEQDSKSIGELAQELGLCKSSVYEVVKNHNTLNSENQLEHMSKHNRNRNAERIVSIFNDRYGANGAQMLSRQDLIKKYDLPTANDAFNNILKRVEKFVIDAGIYTESEVQEIKHARNERIKNERLMKCKVMYHSSRGDCGYEKKSIVQLAKECGNAVITVQSMIKEYKDYLESVNSQQDGEIE